MPAWTHLKNMQNDTNESFADLSNYLSNLLPKTPISYMHTQKYACINVLPEITLGCKIYYTHHL
jgi:hypothetical protein